MCVVSLIFHVIYSQIKLKRNIDQSISTLKLSESKLTKFSEFLDWHNKMSLHETKIILMPSYIEGMGDIFHDLWKLSK